MSNKTKKKKQAMSLSQFHAITPTAASLDGDSGSSGPGSLTQTANAPQQLVRINWADEMEKLDDNTSSAQFLFDRAKLPTAPKSILKPDIDLEQVPKFKPFRAFLGNISFEADEEKLKSFFKDLKVLSVHLATDPGGRSKGSGNIDFDDRDSLIAALNKNESIFLNRPLRISLNDSSRGGYDRSGGYGERREGGGGYGNRQQSSDSSALRSEESNWRREPDVVDSSQSAQSYGGQYSSQSDQQQSYQRYGNRYQSGGGSRDQYNQAGGSGGYQQRRFNQPSGGSGSGYSERRTNRNEEDGGGRYPQQQQRRPFTSGYQQKQYGSDSGRSFEREPESHTEHFEKSQSPAFAASGATNTPPQIVSPTTSMSEVKERPKLNLIPRTLPVEEATAAPVASSIFGGAKPVNTAAREREIEERLKEREKAIAAEKEAAASANQDEQSPLNLDDNEPKQSRSHKTSVTSDDVQNRSHNEQEHVSASKPKNHYNKHDNNNNSNNNNNNRNHVSQSNSFTSPSNQRQHKDSNETRPAENAWKTRNASDLFNNANSEKQSEYSSSDMSRSNNNQTYNNSGNDRRNFNNNDDRRQFNKRPDSQQQNRTFTNRDGNKDRRGGGSGYDRGGKQMGNRNTNQRQFNDRNNNNRSDRQQHHGGFDGYPNATASNDHDSHSNQDLGFNNKFANLKVDVDEVEEDFS